MKDQRWDNIDFEPAAHDVRVEASGLVYYVRAVPKYDNLLSDSSGSLPFLIVELVWGLIVALLNLPLPWKIGIVVLEPHSLRGARVVHKEWLPEDNDPAPRIAELAESLKSGKFQSE